MQNHNPLNQQQQQNQQLPHESQLTTSSLQQKNQKRMQSQPYSQHEQEHKNKTINRDSKGIKQRDQYQYQYQQYLQLQEDKMKVMEMFQEMEQSQLKKYHNQPQPKHEQQRQIQFKPISTPHQQKQSQQENNKNLFKSTRSFYLDDLQNQQEPQLQPSAQQSLQPQTQPNSTNNHFPSLHIAPSPQPVSKYVLALRQTTRFITLLRISYYCTLLRFFFIAFIYYNVNFFIPQPLTPMSPPSPQSLNLTIPISPQSLNTTIPTPSPSLQPPQPITIQKAIPYYEPWNIMIYFLSGSIDMIAIIGYVSLLRFIKMEARIIGERVARQERRNQRKREDRQIRNNRDEGELDQEDNDQHLPPALVRTRLHALMSTHSVFKIGKHSLYQSIYSLILHYKIRNKDYAAAFKITRIMHMFGTFLFFGRMALIQLQSFTQKTPSTFLFQLPKQVALWSFILSAYILSFQVDLSTLQSSSGPYSKFSQFHITKIIKTYKKFMEWKLFYARLLTIGSSIVGFLVMMGFIVGIGKSIQKKNMGQIWQEIGVVGCIGILVACLGIIRVKIEIGLRDIAGRYCEEIDLRKRDVRDKIYHPNLSLFGIQNKLLCQQSNNSVQKSCTSQTSQHSNSKFIKPFLSSRYYYFSTMYRISLFLYIMSIMRESSIKNNFSQNLKALSYFLSFVALLVVEIWKFRTVFNSKISLFDSFKYEDLKHLRSFQTGEKNQVLKNDQKSKSQIQSFCQQCPICLVDYEPQQVIILLYCSHTFHQNCLFDWIKQKKQCPLCRLKIQQGFLGEE